MGNVWIRDKNLDIINIQIKEEIVSWRAKDQKFLREVNREMI